MQSKSLQQKFIDEFTLEIVLNVIKSKIDLIKKREEEERARKAVEAEKLKMKFQTYSQKPLIQQQQQPMIKSIQETKPVQQIQKIQQQQPIIKPQAQPIVMHKEINEPKQTPITPSNVDNTKTATEKILALLNNPQITHVECPSENAEIIIKRAGQTSRTDIKLSKPEVLEVIKYFSEKAKIPLIEGILLARVDNLDISAIVSESSKSSFIIKKMTNYLNMPPRITENPNQNILLKRLSTPLPNLPPNQKL